MAQLSDDCFAFGDAIHPGNGLKQVVVFHLFIDVHDLFNRGIEAGQ